MTGTGHTRARAAATAATLPLLALVGSLLALGGSLWLGAARSVVHHCLTVDGPLALLGVRLELLQDVADCPTGTLALTPAASHGAVLALGLVVPVAAANAALGLLGLGLTALLLRASRTVRAVLGAVVRVLPAPRSAGPVPAARAVPRWHVDLVRPTDLVRALHPHRGPPVALA
ncbi:hypothetical protein [Cellulomonas sp. NPDC058312]|uniref:hypothetical protein n=1 Tax=Cellulomonas sp. NPDC058312 TaxID=3346441 RepID=UPI0036E9B56E